MQRHVRFEISRIRVGARELAEPVTGIVSLRVLVTGAAGFVGSAVRASLLEERFAVQSAVRSPPVTGSPGGDEVVAVGEIDASTDWRDALEGVDAVVHLAARVHQLDDTAADPLAAYRRVNLEGTAALADAAARAVVRRFVFVSTIKVYGESTQPGEPFRPTDGCRPPLDPYALSKWEAERMLRDLCARSSMELVVVQPPLVYGPRMKGNFLRLFEAVDRGIPLPLGRVPNQRSLVFVRNLADLLVRSVREPAAAGRTLLVADGPPISTTELLREVGAALGRPCRLVPVPHAVLRIAGAAARRQGSMERLLGSLVVDDEATRSALQWAPPFTLREGLRETAEWYRRRDPEAVQ